MAKGRMAAIQEEYKHKDEGAFGGGASYLSEDALDHHKIDIFKAKAGEQTYINILPPPDDESYFAFRLAVHYDIGGRNNFLCLDRMLNQACPVCEKRRRLQAEEEPDADLLRALSPKIRYLFFVIDDCDAEGRAKGIQLYDAPMTVNQNVLSMSSDQRSGDVIDISDPEEGRCLRFEKTGKGIQTRYSGFQLIKRDPIGRDIVDLVPTFEELLVVPTYDEVKKCLDGDSGNKGHRHEEEEAKEDAPKDETRRDETRRDEAPAEEPKAEPEPEPEDKVEEPKAEQEAEQKAKKAEPVSNEEVADAKSRIANRLKDMQGKKK